MAKKDNVLEVRGVIEELLPGGMFRVRLENEHEVISHLSGKMRMNRIRLGIGDEVVPALVALIVVIDMVDGGNLKLQV